MIKTNVLDIGLESIT